MATPYNPRLAAIVVASASFMASLDGTVITLAIPRMAASFGVRPVTLSIGITTYIVVMAAMLPASSWIADRLGPRRVLAGAIAGFTLASMLCGASHTLGQFVAARALQASFAALMVPVGNLVLFRTTERRDLVTAVAISTTPGLFAPVIGPPLGGLIIGVLDWRWIFYLNLPVGILGLMLALRFIPRLAGQAGRPFDFAGFALVAAALAALIVGLEQAGAGDGWRGAGLAAVGLLIGWAAWRHLERAEHPIVALDALRIQTFVVACISAGGLVRIPFRAIAFVLPLLLQLGLHLSPFATGLMLLGYNGGDLALKTVAGRILRRHGFRRALTVSASLTAFTTAGVAALSPGMPWPAVAAILVLCGAVRSVLFTGIVSLNFADVPRERIADATVLNQMSSQVIGALSISVAALVVNASALLHGRATSQIAAADYRVAILAAALIGAAAIPIFRRLPEDAGAEVSGHRQASTLPAGGGGPP